MPKKQPNPFKPTAGMNPPELIGRQWVLDEFIDSIENGVGAPYRLMRISGMRGVGKTALLNALTDIARDEYGFNVLNVTSERGLCERIARGIEGLASRQASVSIEPEAFGFKLGSVNLSKGAPRNLDRLMLDACSNRGLLITVDEIQDVDMEELRALGNAVQLVIRAEGDIAFAFAGLPSAIDEAVNHPGATFLQRAASVELSRLKDFEVEQSLRGTMEASGMEIAPKLSARLALASGGHPFMVQLVGYYTWQAAQRRKGDEVDAADVDEGIRSARRGFTASVIRPVISRLTDLQMTYLVAMAGVADDEGVARSGEVASAMGRAVSAVAGVRSALVEAGVIEPEGYGKAKFAVPYLREHLLHDAHADIEA